ncbi:nuclear transport factor 2 family protein, partial [Salmonella enterica subsp. enterica serovar Corvallis]
MTEAENAVAIVKEFLVASMIPDAERAATYMHPEVKITFTGGRAMAGAADIAQFNGARYKWVKKALGEFDAVQHDDYVVIYSNGTLYGEWPDGRPFADNRFIDR